MENTYSPVNPFFYDLIDQEKVKSFSIVIYFGNDNDLEDARGRIESIITNKENAEYLLLDTGSLIRIDRIIVINGIPGPAYDEYDAFALACLDAAGEWICKNKYNGKCRKTKTESPCERRGVLK